MPRASIFISYSRKDEKEKDELMAHLRVLQTAGRVDVWSDDRISAGGDWKQEIEQAMAEARVAILLVTVNFLTSDFILGKEVPELLKRRQSEGLTVLPVIARDCAWQAIDWLQEINVLPRNARPVWADGGSHVDQDLAEVARKVAQIVAPSKPASKPAPPRTDDREPVPGPGRSFALPELPGWVWGIGVLVILVSVIGLGLWTFGDGEPISTIASEPTATPTPTHEPTDTPQPPTFALETPTATVLVIPSLTTQTDLNVRAGPGTNYVLVGLLPSGTTAEIIGRDENQQWWQVRFDPAPGGIGWVSADPAFSTTSNVANVPVAQIPATSTPIPTVPAGMVLVPKGPFEMGSESGEDEKPMHTVTPDAFFIDQYEVTNADFRQCVEAGTCQAPTTCDIGEPTYEDETKEDHPVVCVSWNQAKTYCEWRGARLPTEAEWEKAARGTDGQVYPWDNEFDGNRLNFCDDNCDRSWADEAYDDGYADTAPAGSYPTGVSPYGAYDMAGNVWEWVQSEYRDYPYDPDDGRENLTSTNLRLLRGGSWDGDRNKVRVAYRGFRSNPTYRSNAIGFRCAR